MSHKIGDPKSEIEIGEDEILGSAAAAAAGN
jgi:hypothetical protein